MPMPPLTFLKAKKIDSIRYPYGIQTISTTNNQGYTQTRLPTKAAERQRQGGNQRLQENTRNNKGEEQAKCYEQPRKRRQRQTAEKAADEKLKRWRDNIPTRGINATREDAEQQRLQETTVE